MSLDWQMIGSNTSQWRVVHLNGCDETVRMAENTIERQHRKPRREAWYCILRRIENRVQEVKRGALAHAPFVQITK